MTDGSPTLLFMCSEDKNCELLKKSIASIDIAVTHCSTVGEALKIQALSPRDIVLVSYSMPDMGGIDFLQAVLQISPSSTRVLYGDRSNEESIIKAVIKGIACTYIDDAASESLITTKLNDIIRIRSSINSKKFLDLIPDINSLPINMSVYEQLMEAINDDTPIPEIAKLISRDVTLSAKVLQVANSAFYGNFSGASVEKAILYMGLNPVKDIVLLHSLVANLKMNSAQNRELELIVKHSIETNYYFHAIAKKTPQCPITSLNNSIGIIHDIGKIVQLVFFPIEYSSIAEYRMEYPEADYIACETNSGNAAIAHAEIGAFFLRCWNFNQYSVEAALHHHEPELASVDMRSCIEALFLANTLSDIRDGFNLSLEDALKRCKKMSLKINDLLTILPPI
jgi:HD-like signal output (HDOD) protein/ActR/RegA family two-component response regulator